MNNRYWFLLSKKLSGSATDAELSELGDLLLEHPDWHFAAEQTTAVWEVPVNQANDEQAWENHLLRMEKMGLDTAIFIENDPLEELPVPAAKKPWYKWMAIAATVVVLATGWTFLKGDKTATGTASLATLSSKKVIETKSGHRRKMVLPDGTQVWLNAESKLEFGESYGKTNRDVTLSGEAFFDVVKNTEMPFTIETNKIHIKVTGTAFNVKAYPGEKTSETSLIRGRVEVTINTRPDEKYILKPNEKLVVRDEMVATSSTATLAQTQPEKKAANEPLIQLGYVNFVQDDSAAIETSWVYDRLIFDEESLGEIAHKMERWYGVKISITDPSIAAQQLTYTIKRETVAQALNNMRYALRFNYTINGNNVTITR